MNLAEIQTTLEKYQELVKLTRRKIAIMEKHDYDTYNTAKGIEDIYFEDENETVHVRCDDSCMGCYDSLSFNFPVRFLALGDEELAAEIERRVDEREQRKKVEEENRRMRENEKRKEQELETLRKLKEKYPDQA